MPNDTPKFGRKFRHGEQMSAALSAMALDHIQEKYQPLRFAADLLACAAKVTPATAINWLRRRCAPQADSLGELIKNDAEFRQKLLAWIEGLE